MTRGSHSYKACGSIRDLDQNEIKVLICAKSSNQGMFQRDDQAY